MAKRKKRKPRPGERRRARRAAYQQWLLERLIDRDPTAALFHLLRNAGATVTLYGRPVDESELRAGAERSMLGRLAGETDAQRERAVTALLDTRST